MRPEELRKQLNQQYGLTADPYKMLGVSRQTSHHEIVQAFKAKASVNSDQQLNLAYKMLTVHKKEYDEMYANCFEENLKEANLKKAQNDLEQAQEAAANQQYDLEKMQESLKLDSPNYKLEKVNLPRPAWAMPSPALELDLGAKKLSENSLEFWRDKNNVKEGKAIFSTFHGSPAIYADTANPKNALAAVLLAKSMQAKVLKVNPDLPEKFKAEIAKACKQHKIEFKLAKTAPTPTPQAAKKKEEEETSYKTPLKLRPSPFKS